MSKQNSLVVLSFLVVLCVIHSSCSSSKATTGNGQRVPYLPGPIVIDGMANDWKQVPFTLDPATTLRYAITNDSANLYVCLTTSNPGLQHKIFQMGLKMYFDTSAQKKASCGVQFPLPIDQNALQAIAATGAGDPKAQSDTYRRFIRLQQNQYETFGFPGGGNGLNALGSQEYVTVGFTLTDDDIMVYELKVPLARIYGGPPPPSAFSSPIAIGLDIPGAPRADDPNAPIASEIGQPGSNMTGARFNMGKGGLQRDPYQLNNASVYKEQRTWIKFTLANK